MVCIGIGTIDFHYLLQPLDSLYIYDLLNIRVFLLTFLCEYIFLGISSAMKCVKYFSSNSYVEIFIDS